MKKENIKNAFILSFLLVFVLSLISYFLFRFKYNWIGDIVPEFMGISLLGILVTLALKQNTKFIVFIIGLTISLFLTIYGYVYGVDNNISFLIDLSPELIGSIGLSLILSLIFKKKIWR